MKTRIVTIVSLLAAGAAYAGFRHPIDEGTEEAIAIQNTRLAPTIPVSAPGGASVAKNTKQPSSGKSATPAAEQKSVGQKSVEQNSVGQKSVDGKSVKPGSLPSDVKKPAPHSGNEKVADKSPANYGPALPSAFPRRPSSSGLSVGPIPKAPALPFANHFNVPEVHIPGGDGHLPMTSTQKPGSLGLHNVNRAQIHAFLRQARGLKVPERVYGTDVRSREIATRFAPALHPAPYKSYRTGYQLSLAAIGKISGPPSATQYENMVKRIDALFLGLDTHYPRSVLALWQLSEAESNPKNLQARDALFAGLISQRAGWEIAAANMFESAGQKKVDQQGRYLRLLWKQLEDVSSSAQVDRVVSQIDPAHARELTKEGDKANLAMAKRLFALQSSESKLASLEFEKRIQGKNSREGMELLRLVAQVRSAKTADREAAVAGLKEIEAQGETDRRQEARLALARSYLQKGASVDALALYRQVKKDGKNRLEVTAEQTYAEYMTGNFQDSLGKTMGLESPYFQYGFAPDVHLVEILSRKALCDFGGAEAGVKRFVERYSSELAAIEQMLAAHKAPAAFYEDLIGYAAVEKPMRYQRYLLHNNAVMENQKTMNNALAGLQTLDDLGLRRHMGVDRPEGWDAFATAMRSRWDQRAQMLRKDSAGSALAEAEYMAKRLRNTFAQVELLDLDISTAASKNYNMQSAMNFPVKKQEETKVEKDQFHWPFQDEVWEDELDFLKMKNPSKCALSASNR
jgi:hypothetical protein